MPGYNQTALEYQVLNGNAVTIMAGDQIVGFAQSSTNGIDFGAEELYMIGTQLPGEIQQLKVSMNFSLSSLALTAAGLSRFGQTATWVSILANNSLDFYIVDGSGTVLRAYIGAVCNSYSSDVPANQPITEQTSWLAMDVQDGDGNSLVAGNSALTLSSAGTYASNFVASAS